MSSEWSTDEFIDNVIIAASSRIAEEDEPLKRKVLARRLSYIVINARADFYESVNDASSLLWKSLADTFALGIRGPKDYRERKEFRKAFEKIRSHDLIMRDTSFAFGDDESNADYQKSEEDNDGV